MSTPFIDVASYVDGDGLVESNEKIQLIIISDRELKNERNSLTIPSKVPYVPFGSFTYHLAVDPIRVC